METQRRTDTETQTLKTHRDTEEPQKHNRITGHRTQEWQGLSRRTQFFVTYQVDTWDVEVTAYALTVLGLAKKRLPRSQVSHPALNLKVGIFVLRADSDKIKNGIPTNLPQFSSKIEVEIIACPAEPCAEAGCDSSS